ncbi:hypothetical protein BS78_05G151800 [Paspalum vaginatum]|nr:hypothetical protein BS78_05G151800 [Paspalum vaginatum]
MEQTKNPSEPTELPTKEGSWQPLVLYKNYWLEVHLAHNTMRVQESFQARPDDTILATSPKCGTTWLKALAFTIVNRSKYSFDEHPLHAQHPQAIVPYIEMPADGRRDLSYIDELPSPRLLATHLPLSLLPKSIAEQGCRIVYITRDPKDAFISTWHFKNKMHPKSFISLDDAFDMFCEGFVNYGPCWEHTLEYWKESQARPDGCLFFKYEEMMREPVEHVRKLAAFLGAPFTDEEEDAKVPEQVAKLCSFGNLAGLRVNQTGDFVRKEDMVVEKSTFFRKGKVGDWRNYMDEEKGKKLDRISEEKFKGSGFAY